VAVLTDEMRRMVDDGLGFVATINADGTPNLSPKGTLAAWDEGRLAFADIASPHTSANLERNPSLEVNVVDPLIRRGYRFSGTAVVHRDGATYERGVEFYEQRGTIKARERIRAIVVITVVNARSIRSPAYALGASEEELRSMYRSKLLGDDERT
jgi:predicted pyridoxine 5'-phosphate oxidase superfamily flavin-nucleotide-binding protein